MSKSEFTHKGQKHLKRGGRLASGYHKKPAKSKFMGHTSGQHSVVFDHEIIDGRFVNTKTDRAAIKDVDFVKYGYPDNSQHPKVIRNKNIIKELDNELKNL